MILQTWTLYLYYFDVFCVYSWKVFVKMEWFNGSTSKPMVLYTNARWLEELQTVRCPSSSTSSSRLAVLKLDVASGEYKPTAGPDLKSSQAYTAEFGQSIAKLWSTHRKLWRQHSHLQVLRCDCPGASCPSAEDLVQKPLTVDEDPWADADLAGVLSLAQRSASHSNFAPLVECISSDSADSD
jgi:hypothetical protein